MIGLHSQETYIGIKIAGWQQTILILQLFEPKNMVVLVLFALGFIQDMLKTNLSLKN